MSMLGRQHYEQLPKSTKHPEEQQVFFLNKGRKIIVFSQDFI
jgi:hypothetical protein